MSSKIKIFILILLGVNLVLTSIILNIKYNHAEKDSIYNSSNSCSQYVNFRDLELKYMNMEMSGLKRFTSNKQPILLFYFSTLHCEVCYNRCLEILNDYNNANIKNNVYILGSVENFNMIIFLRKKYPNLKIFDFNDIVIDFNLIEELNYPIFFELGADSKINDAFVPDKNYPDQIKKYIEKKFAKLNI